MKNVLLLTAIFLFASATSVWSQKKSGSANSWSAGFGARVGFGSMLQKIDVESSDRTKGFDGAADFLFCYYFKQTHQSLPSFGIRSGLSLGYRQNSLSMPLDLTYTVADAQGYDITYNITADNVKETDRQFSLEIPVMFSAVYADRVWANLGVKAGFPLMSRYEQKMTEPTISTTYEDLGVTLVGERVTGLIATGDEHSKAKLDASGFNLALSLEAGYYFRFLGRPLGVGVYVDYGLVDNFKGSGDLFADADPTAIDGATSTPAPIVVRSLTDSYVSSVGVFGVGVRAHYMLFGSSKPARKKSSGRANATLRNW